MLLANGASLLYTLALDYQVTSLWEAGHLDILGNEFNRIALEVHMCAFL